MIQDRIKRGWLELSPVQQKISTYILENLEDAAFLSTEKLAEACNVSQASVVRFSKRIGFERYSEMQKSLRLSLRERMTQLDRFRREKEHAKGSKAMRTALQFMHTDIKSIEETISTLDETALNIAVRRIAEARNVFVIGTHSEYGIACYFSSTLGWIRDNVFLIDETHTPAFDRMAEADERDSCLAMSFPPYPAATVRYFSAARAHGVHCIAVTDSPLSPLAEHANEALYAHDEKLSFVDNSAPTVSLLTVLLALICGFDWERSNRKLQEKQRYWEEIGYYYKADDALPFRGTRDDEHNDDPL